MDGALLTHPRDIFYYTGTTRPSALVVGPQEAVLLVRRGMELARQEATLERVEPGGGFNRMAEVLATQGLTGGTLGLALDVLPVELYRRVEEVFSGWEVVDVSRLVLEQRMVKDEQELEATQLAAAIVDAGHAALAALLQPGATELELAAAVEATLRRAGHEGYQPLRHPGARGGGLFLISGENMTVRGGYGLVVTGSGLSAATPYGASRRRIEPGDAVMLDIGATQAGYTADGSRTYVVGRATPAQRALHGVALAAEDAVLDALHPGRPVAEVYAAAVEVVEQGMPPHFAPGELSLPGFVGHGVGLELDEPPVLWDREQTRVEAGMVLAVELEVRGLGAGVMSKVEDTVVVERDGARLLTCSPRDLMVIG